MHMNVAKPLKLYTLEEFELMAKEDGWNYELIEGIIMMSKTCIRASAYQWQYIF